MTKKPTSKKMLSVSTKTGDAGESGLITGERLPKNSLVFEVVGTLDEFNSWLGLVVTKLQTDFSIYSEQLESIQETLFYVGAECAGSKVVKLGQDHLQKLESWSDKIQAQLADDWHTKFVLPGGTELGAYLDLTRAVCRRCEREVVGLSQQIEIRELILKYLNRLSDYLYVLRCLINHSMAYKEKYFISQKISK